MPAPTGRPRRRSPAGGQSGHSADGRLPLPPVARLPPSRSGGNRGTTRDATQSLVTIYKVKGMPIKGLTDAESKLRWAAYTSELNKSAMEVFSKLSPEKQAEVSSKEGLAGWNTDLAKGSIEPRMLILSRKLRNPDTKRVHSNGVSKPLFMNMLEVVNG